MKSEDLPPGPEAVRRWQGTNSESWVFWPDSPAHRCQWPTVRGTARLLETEDLPPGVSAVLQAYCALLAHPVGTENMIARLRALRRAERSAEEATDAE